MLQVYNHGCSIYSLQSYLSYSYSYSLLVIRYLLASLNAKSIDIETRVISSQIENTGTSFYIEKDNNSCER